MLAALRSGRFVAYSQRTWATRLRASPREYSLLRSTLFTHGTSKERSRSHPLLEPFMMIQRTVSSVSTESDSSPSASAISEQQTSLDSSPFTHTTTTSSSSTPNTTSTSPSSSSSSNAGEAHLGADYVPNSYNKTDSSTGKGDSLVSDIFGDGARKEHVLPMSRPATLGRKKKATVPRSSSSSSKSSVPASIEEDYADMDEIELDDDGNVVNVDIDGDDNGDDFRKRPPSAYNRFLSEHKGKPVKETRALWWSLTDEVKKPYFDAYESEMVSYRIWHKQHQTPRLRKPKSSFVHFCIVKGAEIMKQAQEEAVATAATGAATDIGADIGADAGTDIGAGKGSDGAATGDNDVGSSSTGREKVRNAFSQRAQVLSKAWAALDPVEKNKYIEMSQKETDDYYKQVDELGGDIRFVKGGGRMTRAQLERELAECKARLRQYELLERAYLPPPLEEQEEEEGSHEGRQDLSDPAVESTSSRIGEVNDDGDDDVIARAQAQAQEKQQIQQLHHLRQQHMQQLQHQPLSATATAVRAKVAARRAKNAARIARAATAATAAAEARLWSITMASLPPLPPSAAATEAALLASAQAAATKTGKKRGRKPSKKSTSTEASTDALSSSSPTLSSSALSSSESSTATTIERPAKTKRSRSPSSKQKESSTSTLCLHPPAGDTSATTPTSTFTSTFASDNPFAAISDITSTSTSTSALVQPPPAVKPTITKQRLQQLPRLASAKMRASASALDSVGLKVPPGVAPSLTAGAGAGGAGGAGAGLNRRASPARVPVILSRR